jgi:hypothetical protein
MVKPLVTLLVVIFLAKLCNQDTPVAIADWARNHAQELVELLQLKRTWMPHHNTIRRVFQSIVDAAEFERLVREYHQQPGGGGPVGDRREDVTRHAHSRRSASAAYLECV